MKMHFNELFEIVNGAMVPRFSLAIRGVTMTPEDSFGGGMSFGWVDVSQHTNSYFNVGVAYGVHVIKGIYN